MAKERRSKSGSKSRRRPTATKAARKKPSPRALEYSDPSELLEFISSLWARETGKRKSGAKGLVAVTIGTVTAAKLLVRLDNRGELRCEMDPGAVYMIEKQSDELAEQAFRPVGEMALEVSKLLGELDPAEPRVKYLQLVRPGTDWRWVDAPVDDSTIVPPDLMELVDGTTDAAFDVSMEIVSHFGQRRAEAANQRFEQISQLVASFAAAKWCLSVWGNRTRAAFIERLAEIGSEHQYRELHG